MMAPSSVTDGFVTLPLTTGLLSSLGGSFPTAIYGFASAPLDLPANATSFVFAFDGAITIETEKLSFSLVSGMYAACPGEAHVRGQGRGLAVARLGYRGMRLVGGPIEPKGRLRYIDGCSDSLLLPPVVSGDPCLNHLHIPPGTRQTRHTHPSIRVGMIVRGGGRCVTPRADHALSAGLVFLIEPDAPHSFFTDDRALDVIVYHPDSDTGPTHEDHPMVNRTILGSPLSSKRTSGAA